MGSVVKPWVNELSWKKQTVLFCALRGPDAGGHYWLKSWTRWIRRNVLENAAPNKTFMRPEDVKPFREIADDTPLVLDMLPVHFLSHLMHALQVISEDHPDEGVGHIADVAYLELTDYLHLRPETSEQYDRRLEDER